MIHVIVEGIFNFPSRRYPRITLLDPTRDKLTPMVAWELLGDTWGCETGRVWDVKNHFGYRVYPNSIQKIWTMPDEVT